MIFNVCSKCLRNIIIQKCVETKVIMGANVIAESKTVIMDTRDIDEYTLSAARENRDAINHSIIAKQLEGWVTTSAHLSSKFGVSHMRICEIYAGEIQNMHTTKNTLYTLDASRKRKHYCQIYVNNAAMWNIVEVFHYRLVSHMVDRIPERVQTKSAEDKHWVDISLHSRLFSCYIFLHTLTGSGPEGNLARGNNTPSMSGRMRAESEKQAPLWKQGTITEGSA